MSPEINGYYFVRPDCHDRPNFALCFGDTTLALYDLSLSRVVRSVDSPFEVSWWETAALTANGDAIGLVNSRDSTVGLLGWDGSWVWKSTIANPGAVFVSSLGVFCLIRAESAEGSFHAFVVLSNLDGSIVGQLDDHREYYFDDQHQLALFATHDSFVLYGFDGSLKAQVAWTTPYMARSVSFGQGVIAIANLDGSVHVLDWQLRPIWCTEHAAGHQILSIFATDSGGPVLVDHQNNDEGMLSSVPKRGAATRLATIQTRRNVRMVDPHRKFWLFPDLEVVRFS